MSALKVINEDLLRGTYITFAFLSSTGKTESWRVTANQGQQILGHVKWYGPWRGYAFFPEMGTLYEQKCLREIAHFCEVQTQEHRRMRKLVKQVVGMN
jgi:hypothetical protein